MGEHKGWRTRVIRGRHLGLAWDPAAGKYQSQSFDGAAEARQWAIDQAARFRAKVDAIAVAARTTAGMAKDYLAELERLGRSTTHRHDVEQVLASYAVAVPDLAHPRAAELTKGWLAARPDLSPATRNRYLVTAKALCRWATETGRIPRHPLTAVKREKVPDFLKEQFSLEELSAIACADGDPYHLRASLMIYCGLRVHEAAALTWERVDLAAMRARVVGKGQKERIVPVPAELAELLKAARPEAAAGEMFPDRQASLGREFGAFLDRLGLPRRGRTPHSCRHCYAGLMTASGVPSILLAAYMGHAAQQTTAGYAKLAATYASQVRGWTMGEIRLRSSPLIAARAAQAR